MQNNKLHMLEHGISHGLHRNGSAATLPSSLHLSLASRSYSQRLDVVEKGVLGSEEHDESIRDGYRSPQRPSFFDFFSPVDSAFQVSACLGHGS